MYTAKKRKSFILHTPCSLYEWTDNFMLLFNQTVCLVRNTCGENATKQLQYEYRSSDTEISNS
jgi:ferredoxin-like protein FixX